MKTQYDPKTDAVIYGCDATSNFTGEDWRRLALAALDQAGELPVTATMRDAWRAMYAGAFAALNILNPAMIFELADLTRSSDEATGAILAMRAAREGDRVWPALAWLRARRGVSS